MLAEALTEVLHSEWLSVNLDHLVIFTMLRNLVHSRLCFPHTEIKKKDRLVEPRIRGGGTWRSYTWAVMRPVAEGSRLI